MTVMMKAMILCPTRKSCILPLIFSEKRRSNGVKSGLSGGEEVGLALLIQPMRNQVCSALRTLVF